MRLYVWDDGRVVDSSEFRLTQPFVLQRVHTLGYKAINIAHHIDIMRSATTELFGFATLCDARSAANIIEQLTRLSRINPALSCAVAMRHNSEGELSFEVEMPTPYRGVELSVKRPRGAFLTVPQPAYVSQNSVTLALDAMYNARVQGYGDVAVLLNSRDEVISRPWQPLFAVFHNVIYTPVEHHTVEYCAVRDAAHRAGIEFVVRPIPSESLLRMDEVFIADTMGLTALSSIKESRLLSVVATHIANRMEPKLSTLSGLL